MIRPVARLLNLLYSHAHSIDSARSCDRSAVFLASSANRSGGVLPGVHVRSYASSPTRDRRAEAAERASQARAEHAQKIAAKLQQERRTVTALVRKISESDERSDKVDTNKIQFVLLLT